MAAKAAAAAVLGSCHMLYQISLQQSSPLTFFTVKLLLLPCALLNLLVVCIMLRVALGGFSQSSPLIERDPLLDLSSLLYVVYLLLLQCRMHTYSS